jgi:hypothetical protein
VYSNGTLYTPPQYPSSKQGEILCLLFESKRDFNPISRPQNPPLLHFMIYAYLGYHFIRGPLFWVCPYHGGFLLNQIICICLYFHTLCSLAPLHIQIAIFFSFPHFTLNSILFYFLSGDLGPLRRCLFSHIFLTPNFRGLLG